MTGFHLLLVFAGGGVGSACRYAAGEWAAARWPDAHFPWHTFAINVAGCFALGVLAGGCRDRRELYLLFGTGFCGGFTTFSTFGVETLQLLDADRPAAAAAYAAGSVAAGLIGAGLGLRLGR